MFLNLLLATFILGKEYIKEKTTPVIPANYWNNKDLIYKDRIERCISPEEFMCNLQNGKYYLPEPSEKTKEKQKHDLEHTVYVSRGGWFGKKEYKEFLPYGTSGRQYQVYDEDWKIWLVVHERSLEMQKISGCKYVYRFDSEELNRE